MDPQPVTYYVAMRGSGVFILEEPDECGYLDPPQACLRLFSSSAQARHYIQNNLHDRKDLKVRSTDLLSIWNILSHIDILSQKQFGGPVRVEVCVFVGDNLKTTSTLRSPYGLMS